MGRWYRRRFERRRSIDGFTHTISIHVTPNLPSGEVQRGRSVAGLFRGRVPASRVPVRNRTVSVNTTALVCWRSRVDLVRSGWFPRREWLLSSVFAPLRRLDPSRSVDELRSDCGSRSRVGRDRGRRRFCSDYGRIVTGGCRLSGIDTRPARRRTGGSCLGLGPVWIGSTVGVGTSTSCGELAVHSRSRSLPNRFRGSGLGRNW